MFRGNSLLKAQIAILTIVSLNLGVLPINARAGDLVPSDDLTSGGHRTCTGARTECEAEAVEHANCKGGRPARKRSNCRCDGRLSRGVESESEER